MFSGSAKAVSGREHTRRAIASYKLIPAPWLSWASLFFPTVEITIGLSLVVGLATRLVAISAAVLVLLIAVGVAVVLLRGERIPCGCFGRYFDQLISWKIVARNMLLAAFSACLVIFGDDGTGIDDVIGYSWRGRAVVTGGVVALGIGLTAFLLHRAMSPETDLEKAGT